MHDVLRSRLPSHHIRRARLTRLCADERVVVVEAAGGYGKSILAAELVDTWGALPVWVLLEPGGVSGRLFAARLRAAVAGAGLTDAAGAMAATGDDPPGAVDAMLSGLSGESYAVVVDDVQYADADAAALINRIADQLTGQGRLVVLGRRLPAGLARLRRAHARQLNARDLSLAPDETLELCRSGFGLAVSVQDAQLLDLATGGWTAAAVLAASRSKRSDRPIGMIARSAAAQRDVMASILDEALSSSGTDRALFARIAAPPLLDDELLTLITGDPGFLERALTLGLPMTLAEGGWWVLPDPVREHLAALGPADASVLQIAAGHYEKRDQFGTALQLLIGAGDLDGAARLLDRADPWVIDSVDAAELLSVLDAIPDAVLDRFPRGLLTVARCISGSWMMSQSGELFARVDALVSERDSPELRRAIDIELVSRLIDGADRRQAEPGARRILAGVGPDEVLTRARALTVLGNSLSGRRDDTGSLDTAALREAGDCLQRAGELQLGLGNRPAAATITIFQALWIELPLGRPELALEIINTGLALAADHPRRFAQILFCRALVLTELGRHSDVEADLDEVLRLGRQLGDRWMAGYVAWASMMGASMRGDGEATVRHAREASAEARTGSWWDYDGSECLADAADCLDRIGETPLAIEYLERAREQRKQAEPQIAMAECAVLARHGDPALARRRLAIVHEHGIAPRERWRVTLLDAHAAFRLGDGAAAGLAARAFEQAAELGQAEAPLLRERAVTESLLALAGATGMPAARALQAATLPTAVVVLGRFELTLGGRPVALGNSQEARLLKLVAVSGGAVHTEQAIEALWPEVDPRAGRNRLRTVLNRLRDAAPAVVIREGEQLAIGPGARVDIAQFMSEAGRARALGQGDPGAAVALARSAIARYRGPLLPFDPYEEWAQEPRDAAQRTMLELLDLCAEAAARKGDLDEARRMVERTIELAPYDDHRYLRVASILHEQGRKGAALSVLRRARSALAQLGVDPPEQLVALERIVAAARTRDPRPEPFSRA